jgi:hypothetical protein
VLRVGLGAHCLDLPGPGKGPDEAESHPKPGWEEGPALTTPLRPSPRVTLSLTHQVGVSGAAFVLTGNLAASYTGSVAVQSVFSVLQRRMLARKMQASAHLLCVVEAKGVCYVGLWVSL